MWFLLIIIAIGLNYYLKIVNYNKSNYKKETNKNYLSVRGDKGVYGEYLTFNELEKINGYKQILVNIYIPKENKANETTEIDVLMVHETGIYVFESKNYSGWIFGDDNNQYWTQTFPNGRKERFFNPVLQNKGHLKHLSALLKMDISNFKSVIVFSQRCELKKVTISQDILLFKRNYLSSILKSKIQNSSPILSKERVVDIYNQLKPFTCVSDEIKTSHVNNIQNTYH